MVGHLSRFIADSTGSIKCSRKGPLGLATFPFPGIANPNFTKSSYMTLSNAILTKSNILSVHDLPQLYTRPSFSALQSTLLSLAAKSTNIRIPRAAALAHYQHGHNTSSSFPRPISISPVGVPRYLTSIIASSLSWLSESQAAVIHELASYRLAERAGRMAIPDREQVFQIPLGNDGGREGGDDKPRRSGGKRIVELQIFEPSLTEDNLGLKTWGAGALLAGYLGKLQEHLLGPLIYDIGKERKMSRARERRALRILELGAGTGVVGLAAAAVLANILEKRKRSRLGSNVEDDTHGETQKEYGQATVEIQMTDLPPILNNLRKNIRANVSVVGGQYVEEEARQVEENVHSAYSQNDNRSEMFLSAGALDWSLSPPFSRPGTEYPHGTIRSTTTLGDDHSQQSHDCSSFSDTVSRSPFDVILVADPLYSSDHPHWLTNTIAQNLLRRDNSNGCHARVISALPLRSHYADVRAVWARLMDEAGFTRLSSGLLTGKEDWDDGNRDDDVEYDVDRRSNAEEFDEGGKGGNIMVEWTVWTWA